MMNRTPSSILTFLLLVISYHLNTATAASLSEQERRDRELVSNEDVGIYDEVHNDITFEPFRLRVEPTPEMLDNNQAQAVMGEIKDIMSDYLSSLPSNVVGNFQSVEFYSLDRISFDAGGDGPQRRSLTTPARTRNMDSASIKRYAEAGDPATTLQIGGIEVSFINNAPSKESIRGWLETSVNDHNFSGKDEIPTSVKMMTSPLLAGISIESVSLIWEEDFAPTAAPSPSPTPEKSVDTIDVITITEPSGENTTNIGLPLSLTGASICLILLSLFLVRRRRGKSEPRALVHDTSTGDNEFGGFGDIYDCDLGSKFGGFPIFGKNRKTLPPAKPEELEVSVPGKAMSEVSSLDDSEHNTPATDALVEALKSFPLRDVGVSDVSSLGASDHNATPAAEAARSMKPFPLTNLTRVKGNLYNETHEGFDRLEDAWISDLDGAKTGNMPGMLGDNASFRYSDTSSFSLETEHFYPDKSWDPNDSGMADNVDENYDGKANERPKRVVRTQYSADQYDIDDVVDYDDSSDIQDVLPSVV
jgi:hypothetical protein